MPSFLLTAVPLYHPPFSLLPACEGCLSFPPTILCICGKHTGWRCYFGLVPLVGCCTESREVQRALGEQHLYSPSKPSPRMTCGFGGFNTTERDFAVKRCKETVLYNRVVVMVVIASRRATGLGVLTEWKNTCRSPAWSSARTERPTAAAAWLWLLQPRGCVTAASLALAPGGTSPAAVT